MIKSLIVIILLMNVAHAGRLSDLLNRFKEETYCKVTISSGKRSFQENQRVGGAKNSFHLSGKAYDLVFTECFTSMDDLGKLAKKYFNGVIVYKKHIHVDIRKKPYYGKGKY